MAKLLRKDKARRAKLAALGIDYDFPGFVASLNDREVEAGPFQGKKKRKSEGEGEVSRHACCHESSRTFHRLKFFFIDFVSTTAAVRRETVEWSNTPGFCTLRDTSGRPFCVNASVLYGSATPLDAAKVNRTTGKISSSWRNSSAGKEPPNVGGMPFLTFRNVKIPTAVPSRRPCYATGWLTTGKKVKLSIEPI